MSDAAGHTLRRSVEYLKRVGADSVDHTEGTYIAHCAAVYRDMKRWGADEELALAGFFHSAYGTGLFQRFKLGLERRTEIRELVGERAERLAYLNCAIVYACFDAELERGTPPYRMQNRLEGGELELSTDDFEDLCLMQLCDRLEQIPRSKAYDFRREAFRRMAERMGGPGLEAYRRVYSAPEAVVTPA